MIPSKIFSRYSKSVLFVLAAACLVASAGCSGSSRYSFTFSPEGKKVAYLSQSRLLLYDFQTSQYKILLEPEEGFDYGAVFWPVEKDELVIIQAKHNSICEKSKYFPLKVTRINPDTGETRMVFQKQLPCEFEKLTNLPGLYPYFNDEAAVLIINENIFSLSEKPTPAAKALAKLVERVLVKKKKRVGQYVEVPYAFNFSPDKRFVYFMMYKSDERDRDNELFIFRLDDGKILKIPRTFNSHDLNGELEPTDFAKWDTSSEAIYYPGVFRGKESIIRYKISTREETPVFIQRRILAFDPFPSGDRILVLYEENESNFVSIIKTDGAILKTFPFWKEENTSCFMADNAIKVSRDGLYAVYPFCKALVFFDLKNQRDEIFAYSESDHVAAGVVFSRANRFEKAIPHFEKAGEDGLPGLYLIYFIMRRNDEANDVYEKMMNAYARGNKNPHYILGDKIEGFFDTMPFGLDLAKKEFLKVTGPEQGMAFFRLGTSTMMTTVDEEDIQFLQFLKKALFSFRDQGCYEEPPSSQCFSDMEMVDNAPFELGRHYIGDDKPEYLLNLKKDFPRTYRKHFEEIHSNLLEYFTEKELFKDALVHAKILLDNYIGQPQTWRDENVEIIKEARRTVIHLKKKCSQKK